MRATTVEIQGHAMRVIREARGRKVADLAEAVGVHRSYLTKVEIGKVTRVSSTVYAALLRELAITDYRALLANLPPRLDSIPPAEPGPIAAAS